MKHDEIPVTDEQLPKKRDRSKAALAAKQSDFEQFWSQVQERYKEQFTDFPKEMFKSIWRDIRMFDAQKIMADLGRT